MNAYTPGPTGTFILRRMVDGGWHRMASPNEYAAALKVHDRGLLDRDHADPWTFRITGEGLAMLVRLARARQSADMLRAA